MQLKFSAPYSNSGTPAGLAGIGRAESSDFVALSPSGAFMGAFVKV